jgi:hypothetical protein
MNTPIVIPAKAETQTLGYGRTCLGPRFRGDDVFGEHICR